MRKKNKTKRCATRYCRGHVTDAHLKCSKCRKREFKTAHPERYLFHVVKNNAKRRGKPFTLTMEYFMALIVPTGYLERRGHAPHDLSIDRIDSARGYEPGNVRIITIAENCAKGNRDEWPF
jgi:hypothetical protein